MHLGLFNEDEVAQRTIFGCEEPLRVKVSSLNGHIDEVLET